MISDEIHAQLVIQKISKILSEFAILCQQIDENFWYNQSTWFWKITTQSINVIILLIKTNTFSRNTIMITHNFININSAWFYASADSEKWKNHITKNACFDCNQKKHWHKNCLTNSYSKICQAIALNENEQAISLRKTYTVSVTSSKMSDKKHSIFFHVIISCIMSSDESENELFWD